MKRYAATPLVRAASLAVAGVVVYAAVLWLLTGDATPRLNETSVVWGLLVVAFVVGLAVRRNA